MTLVDEAQRRQERNDRLAGQLRTIAWREGGRMFMDWPDRWWASPQWRCINNHVSTTVLRSEGLGRDACLAAGCRERVHLTFPEDTDGPLRHPPHPCPDCAVKPGERHEPGCDVARCKGCGTQAIQCAEHAHLPQTAWTGRWPGEEECEELGLWITTESVMRPNHRPFVKTTADDPDRTADLNELALRHARGELRWDPEAERLVKP